MERVRKGKVVAVADKPDVWHIFRGILADPLAPSHLPFVFSGSGILVLLLLGISGILSNDTVATPKKVLNINQQFTPAERAAAPVITGSIPEQGAKRPPMLRSDSTAFKPQINFLEAKVALLENRINSLKEELDATRTNEQKLARRLGAIEGSFGTVTGSINRKVTLLPAENNSLAKGQNKSLPPLTALAPLGVIGNNSKIPAIDNSPLVPSQTMFVVFLGSNSDRQVLQGYREELRSKYSTLLKGVDIYVVKPKGGEKKFRLVAGPLKNVASAATICVELKSDGLFCHQDVYSRTLLTDLN